MTSVSRGRPQASSRETLADAACELFLEQGYDATTVADITRRAGVSRSSFFNYFDGKSETIWFALDEHLARCAELLQRNQGELRTAGDALSALASDLGDAPPHTLALAITNADVMGAAPELTTGRALRQAALAAAVESAGRPRTQQTDPFARELRAAAQAAAVFAAIWRWAERGAGSHRLDTEIEEALHAVPGDAGANGQALRVAVIGTGAIGARVIGELAAGRIAGAELSGVVTRRGDAFTRALGALGAGHPAEDFGADIARAIAVSDVIVECAGIVACRQYGPSVIAAGRTLVAVSIGALADPALREALTGGAGTLRLSPGAIGGLDVLAAAARPSGIPGGIRAASITTTKRAVTLRQNWMSDAEARALSDASEAFTLFAGTVAEAVERFPGSLNVACALAHATGLWDEVEVRLIADPHAERTGHEIAASGAAGDYRFAISNAVSAANPTSSAVVAESVLRGIAALARPSATFV